MYMLAQKKYSFVTNDHILEYISNMGGNMIPYSIAKGEKINSFYLHIANV